MAGNGELSKKEDIKNIKIKGNNKDVFRHIFFCCLFLRFKSARKEVYTMSMFDMEAFSQLLDKQKSMNFSDREEEVLLTYREEERQEKRRLLSVCHKVMYAQSMDDLADVPLEDIVKCIEVYEDFYGLYCESNGGEELRSYGRRLNEAKTCRRKRVL